MIRFIAAASIALLPATAMAQAQAEIPVYSGEVTAENAERLTHALANRVDTIVGLQVEVSPTDDKSPAGYLVDQITADAGVFISTTYPQQGGGVQINVPTAYWRHGSYIIDGFYVVKYGGMGQGILGYQLKPVDDAVVLLSSARRVTVETDKIPREQRAVVAD